MKDKSEQEKNVMTMVPAYNTEFEYADDKVVLLEPKLKSKFLKKHLLPRMKRSHYKIHLDDYGTFVWKQIDGNRTVFDIAVQLEEHYGDKVEPVYERLGMFINMLAQRKFITLN
ncbi:MAG: PqqD family protein [candidate division KSB1 bacterium]|nr:PqqD family protein [candidate division KSB1 bacterium]